MVWASIWQLDLENRIRESGGIHNCKYWDGELLNNIAFAAAAKTVNLNDEFLRFPWSDYLDQGVKLKLRAFSIQWYKIIPVFILFPT